MWQANGYCSFVTSQRLGITTFLRIFWNCDYKNVHENSENIYTMKITMLTVYHRTSTYELENLAEISVHWMKIYQQNVYTWRPQLNHGC